MLLAFINSNNNIYRVAWSKLYPTDEWKKSHQRTLLSICLNEFKMPRADFKLMLLHFRMVPLDETKKLAEQVIFYFYCTKK